MTLFVVPLMLLLSSFLMALAWLGHVRFRRIGLPLATLISWLVVLPEYVLNVSAIRLGHGVYTGGEMASFNLCTGVLCVAIVSRWFLRELMNAYQIVGFCLMAVAIFLIVYD